MNLNTTLQENKNNFFSLRINLMNSEESSRESVDVSMEKVMKMISCNDCFSFYSQSGLTVVFFLKTLDRKRPAQIRRSVESYLPMNLISDYHLIVNTKQVFYDSIINFKSHQNWIAVRTPESDDQYDASDIQIFYNYDNFFEWQKQIHSIIFEDHDGEKRIRIDDDRTINVVVDLQGNMGKSKFIKFLTHEYDDIEFFPVGSAQQLRSYLIVTGPRKVYLLDIPRTLGKQDSLTDLISVAESCKNGLLTSPMYGKRKKLYMVPPIIILFSNQHLPYQYLSLDRWKIWVTSYNKDGKVERLKKYNVYKHLRSIKAKKFRTFTRAFLNDLVLNKSSRLLKMIMLFYFLLVIIKYRFEVLSILKQFVFYLYTRLPSVGSSPVRVETEATFLQDIKTKSETVRKLWTDAYALFDSLGITIQPSEHEFYDYECDLETLISRALKRS